MSKWDASWQFQSLTFKNLMERGTVVGTIVRKPLYYTWKIHVCEWSGAKNRGSGRVSNGKMSDGQMSHLSKRQRSICRARAKASQHVWEVVSHIGDDVWLFCLTPSQERCRLKNTKLFWYKWTSFDVGIEMPLLTRPLTAFNEREADANTTISQQISSQLNITTHQIIELLVEKWCHSAAGELQELQAKPRPPVSTINSINVCVFLIFWQLLNGSIFFIPRATVLN